MVSFPNARWLLCCSPSPLNSGRIDFLFVKFSFFPYWLKFKSPLFRSNLDQVLCSFSERVPATGNIEEKEGQMLLTAQHAQILKDTSLRPNAVYHVHLTPTYMYTNTCIHTEAHVHMHTHRHTQDNTHGHTGTHTGIQTHTGTHSSIYKQTQTHRGTKTHTHTHTQAYEQAAMKQCVYVPPLG